MPLDDGEAGAYPDLGVMELVHVVQKCTRVGVR